MPISLWLWQKNKVQCPSLNDVIKYFLTYQAWVEQIFNKQTKITIFFAFISVMIVDILAFKIGLSSEKPFNLVCSALFRSSPCAPLLRACACAGQVNSAPVKYKRMVYYWTKELCGCCILLFIPNQCKGQISNEKNKSNDYFKWKVF